MESQWDILLDPVAQGLVDLKIWTDGGLCGCYPDPQTIAAGSAGYHTNDIYSAPGALRLVCLAWASQVARNIRELQPRGRIPPPKWTEKFCNLCRLDLSGCMGLRLAEHDLRGLRRLREICLPSSAEDGDLAPLRPLASLQSVGLALCRRITDAGLQRLSPLQELAALDITGCGSLSPGALARLCGPPQGPRLADLGAGLCPAAASASVLPAATLRRLDLQDNPGLDADSAAARLAALQPRLEELSLRHCPLLTDAGAEAASRLRHLTRLRLDGCHQLTDAAAASISRLSRLRKLGLAWCGLLTDRAAESLAGLGSLADLDLAGCELLTDSALRHLASLPSLSRLSLGDAHRLTDAGCAWLAAAPSSTGAPRPIEELDLSGCPLLTDRSLAALLSGLPRLRLVDVRGTRVSDGAAAAATAGSGHRRPRVRVLARPPHRGGGAEQPPTAAGGCG